MLHGETHIRGVDPHQSQSPARSQFHVRGRFGRLFQGLPPFAQADSPVIRGKLLELGAAGGLMDGGAPTAVNPDNLTIPAGFTFFGQFVDHDLTFDPTSSLERQNDPEALENFRTPSLELDNVYGSGPRASRHLYDINDPAKLLVEKLKDEVDPAPPPDAQDDMPRNGQRTGLIGDPRNDENVIVSQLHVAFLKFHNAVVDRVRAKGTPEAQVFELAQRMVRWHYQWIVLNEFLPLTVGESVVQDVRRLHPRDRLYQFRHEPFIPVEFSVAAYRFGHSQVRPFYRLNRSFKPDGAAAPVGFSGGFFTIPPAPPGAPENPDDLRGGKRARRRFVEWENFFAVGDATRRQNSKKIDSRLSPPLFTMPGGAPGTQPGLNSGSPTNPESLAQRNLLRSLVLDLPSGQAMARRVGAPVLTPDQLADLKQFNAGFERSTPPWFYMLKEAELVTNGDRLGPLGGRIVAEVIIGILQGDRFSFLNANPNWRPELANDKGEFFMADLLRFAGVKLTDQA
jgi:hypothetical protein